MRSMEGLDLEWSCWFSGIGRAAFLDLARRTIAGDHDPREVILMDLDPPRQKTAIDQFDIHHSAFDSRHFFESMANQSFTMTTPSNIDTTSADWSDEWSFPDGVTYLNHGSFGPSPRCVREARQAWSERLEQQPMDFFLRQMEPALDDAAEKLGRFIGADGDDLLFCDNATVAMNIVAESVSRSLRPGDEILFTDQEYGAVMRIWRRACERA